MPPGASVRPGKWERVIDLYDSEGYSAIWGDYGHTGHRYLGVRWNGEGSNLQGYPNQGRYPLWYVEPLIFTEAILLKIKALLLDREYDHRDHEYLRNVEISLEEFYDLRRPDAAN